MSDSKKRKNPQLVADPQYVEGYAVHIKETLFPLCTLPSNFKLKKATSQKREIVIDDDTKIIDG